MSVYCYYHGYMGGENLLTYTDKCDITRGTANGFGPATLIVKSFFNSNTGVRTVELIKKLGEDTVLTHLKIRKPIFLNLISWNNICWKWSWWYCWC